MFNYRGEQTHFKGKRTQGEYVSIRVNGHDTVLTWEQFDWKSGGGKEDLKNKLKLFSFVTSRSTVIIVYTYIYIYIYNTARRFNSIFIYMYNFSKQTYGLHFYFQHAFGLIIYFHLLRRTKYLFSKSSWSPQDIKWLSHYLFFQTGEEHKICLSSELKPRMYTKNICNASPPPFFFCSHLFNSAFLHKNHAFNRKLV